MPDLTLAKIERLRTLEKAATPGPLRSHDFVEFAPGGHFRLPRVETENGLGIASAHDVGDVNETNANASLFAALRNAAPALLDMAQECLRLRAFARLCASRSFEGYDMLGDEIQDELVKAGFLVETRYDPEKHGESDCAVPGDRWYVEAPR